MKDSYKLAESKAQEIIKELPTQTSMLDTEEVVKLVQKKTKYNIKVYRINFTHLGIDDIKDFGGLISVVKKKEKGQNGEAAIYLNSINSPQMMRFSLMHEIGHLMTMNLDTLEAGKMYASPHINADINFLNDEIVGDNKFLEDEQAANIFALSILMPSNLFDYYRGQQYLIEELADIFGVTVEAVQSRVKLQKMV